MNDLIRLQDMANVIECEVSEGWYDGEYGYIVRGHGSADEVFIGKGFEQAKAWLDNEIEVLEEERRELIEKAVRNANEEVRVFIGAVDKIGNSSLDIEHFITNFIPQLIDGEDHRDYNMNFERVDENTVFLSTAFYLEQDNRWIEGIDVYIEFNILDEDEDLEEVIGEVKEISIEVV